MSKKKIIVGVAVAVLTISTVAIVVKSPGVDNNTEVSVNDKENDEMIVLEYGVTPDPQYDINVKGETQSVNTPKNIDVMVVGESEHAVDLEDGTKLVIKVKVKDTQKPVITGHTGYEVLEGSDKDSLESLLKESMSAEDPIDGKLEVDFKYNKLNLKKIGDYEISVISEDINGNVTTVPVNVSVLAKEDFEKKHGAEAQVVPVGDRVGLVISEDDESFVGPKEAEVKEEKEDSVPVPHGPQREPKAPRRKDKDEESPTANLDPEKDPMPQGIPKDPKYKNPKTVRNDPSEDKVPSGLPKDAKFLGKDRDFEVYSFDYSIKLEDGGSIEQVIVNDRWDNVSVAISGDDIDGNEYGAIYSQGQLSYEYFYPKLSSESTNMIRDIGSKFAKAYDSK